MTALRAGVAETRPAARLIRRVVLDVALGGGPPADGAGAGGVPDLGQVPQLDPGIMALGFEPVLTRVGGDRVDGDDQVRAVSGSASAARCHTRRAVPSRLAGVKVNPPSPGGGPGPARFRVLLGSGRAQPWATACPWPSVTVRHQVDFGFAAAAAARSRASHGSTGPRLPSSPGRSARPARVASGTVSVTRAAGPAGARRRPCRAGPGRDGSLCPGAGPGTRGRGAGPCHPPARRPSAPWPGR